MKKFAFTALATIAVLTMAVPAEAQHRGGGQPSLTLYTGVDYREQSVVITSDIPDLNSINFDEAAGSLVARGEWQVCLDINYGSRCRIYSDAIPNLESFRGRISSVRFMGNQHSDGNTGGGWGNSGNGGWGNSGGGGWGNSGGGGWGNSGGGGWGNSGGGGWGNSSGGGGWGNTQPRHNGQAVAGRSTVFYPGSIQGFGGSRAADNFCRAQGNNSAVYAGQDRNGNLEDVLCRR